MENSVALKNESKDIIESEVKKIFNKKNGKLNTIDFIELKKKYNNDTDLILKIENEYNERYNLIKKKAKKFAQLIKDKYGNRNYPYHTLLEKAHIYKNKYDLSDEEFHEFQHIYEEELTGRNQEDYDQPNTNLMKLLGAPTLFYTPTTVSLKPNEYKELQEILRLYSASKVLHSQIFMQSLQYKDLDYLALNGTIKRELGQNAIDHIHPIIVALFAPKIDILENNFLYSNIGGIIKNRYNKEPISTKADLMLYQDLIKDPNDIICDNQSTVSDLLNRVKVQIQLWQCVLNLRNGYYYNGTFREFINSIDVCKINKYDNPDLIYGRYDGTIIKRLLSIFSFRPTIVVTTPIVNNFSVNPYNFTARPLVTSIHMINIRVPPTISNEEPIELINGLEQYQLFRENNVIVPKLTNIIYSRGVLFFFIDRRSNVIRFNENRILNISRLPIAVSGLERLNTRPVSYIESIQIRNEKYNLRSIVCAELSKTTEEENIVIGSSTILIKPVDLENNITRSEYYIYNPLNVNVPEEKLSTTGKYNYISNPVIEYTADPNCDSMIYDIASRQGIIFMYEKVTNKSKENDDILY
jgi:hypothetical protein